MKRIFAFLCAFGIAIPPPVVLPAPAAAQGRSSIPDFCKVDVPQNPPFVVGDCVGFINNWINDSEGFVRFKCDYLSVAQPDLFFAAYDGVPECIRDRASELPQPPY